MDAEVEKLKPILQEAFRATTSVYLTDNGLDKMATLLVTNGIVTTDAEEKIKQNVALRALQQAIIKPPKVNAADIPVINKQLIDAATAVCSIFLK
jgi:hypothetical protein